MNDRVDDDSEGVEASTNPEDEPVEDGSMAEATTRTTAAGMRAWAIDLVAMAADLDGRDETKLTDVEGSGDALAEAHQLLDKLSSVFSVTGARSSKTLVNERKRSSTRLELPRGKRNISKTMARPAAESWLNASEAAADLGFYFLRCSNDLHDDYCTKKARDELAATVASARFAVDHPEGDRKSHQRAAIVAAVDYAAAEVRAMVWRSVAPEDGLSIGAEFFFIHLGSRDALLGRELRQHEGLVEAAIETTAASMTTPRSKPRWTRAQQRAFGALLKSVGLCPPSLATIKRSSAKVRSASAQRHATIARRRKLGL